MAGNNAYDILDSISYYEDREVIFAEGGYGDEMYIIHSGEVELSQVTSDNERKVLDILGKDSFFGEMALLSNTVRTATATAVGKTALIPFDKEAMIKRIESNPRFALHLLASLSDRLMKTTSTLMKLLAIIEEHGDEQIQSMVNQSLPS